MSSVAGTVNHEPSDGFQTAGVENVNMPGRRRVGIPLVVDDSGSSYAPLISSTYTTLKGFLPLSPPKNPNRAQTSRPVRSVIEASSSTWQVADLGDGRNSNLLLLTSATHALQVFLFRNGVIPDDRDVQEAFPSPEEVVSIPTLTTEEGAHRTALPGATVARSPKQERVLSAHILDKAHWGSRGPAVALVTHSQGSSLPPHGNLAVALVSLTSLAVYRRIDLGVGINASVTSSSKAIVISCSHPTPSIHVLDTNLNVVKSITDLPANSHSSLPVYSVSGRLLAFGTAEASPLPGPDGLGSVVAASSTRPRNNSTTTRSQPATAQGALFNSAVEIGGGVARGVWAGLKAGAKAASQASGGRLAQSAPNETDTNLGGTPSSTRKEGESRSVEDFQDESSPSEVISRPPGGVWIKVLDVFPTNTNPRDNGVELIAHFRLPKTRSLIPTQLPTGHKGKPNSASPEGHVGFLSFAPGGTRLFAAPADGRVFHILDIRPKGAHAFKKHAIGGEVWHAYILRRGNTFARVHSVSWAKGGRWVAVATGKGTVHVFPLCPDGGLPMAASHVPLKLANPTNISPLSVEVYPSARLRVPQLPNEPEDDGASSQSAAVSAFVASRTNPLDRKALFQDVAIYHSGMRQLALARLSVQRASPDPQTDTAQPGTARRSNLSEMMREKAGLVSDSDLSVHASVKARWSIPLGHGRGETPVSWKRRSGVCKPNTNKPAGNSLHHAEIRTFSDSPRLLPSSIYLSRQALFYAVVPTDEYNPLSVLDKMARIDRLLFRPEVEVLPSTPELSNSFNEPLSTALHSIMESRPIPQLPGLPNGSPSRPSLWNSIPIRQVTANLGEGVGRVKREYARAQHARQRRRESNSGAGISLSFEDNTVMATAATDGEGEAGGEGDEEGSERPTEPHPSTTPHALTDGPAERDSDDGWGERWEDDYARAVEDDGGPEDLVLGLMDEEEEERRVWETKHKQNAELAESLKSPHGG